jgi:hypothetical protein
MGQNNKYIFSILLSNSLVPESARWLAVHGRVDAQKTWKRFLLCNQGDVLNNTDSIKVMTDESKCHECDSGHLSENKITRTQQTVDNDIIQVDSDTQIQLPADEGKACERIIKQEVVKDKLKDCSGWCDSSSVSTEHLVILPNHVSSVEYRSCGNLCQQDGCDSTKSQNIHYSGVSYSTIEASYLSSYNAIMNCKENAAGTHGVDKKKEKKSIKSEEIADVNLVDINNSSSSMMKNDFDKEFKIELLCKECKGMLHGITLDRINYDNDVPVDTIGRTYHAEIRTETGDSRNSGEYNSLSLCRSICRSESDGLDFIYTEAAQDLKSDDETSASVQRMSVMNYETITRDDRNGKVCIRRTFPANYKKAGADEVRSTYRKIALGEEYGMVNEKELVKINSILAECNGTNSETLNDRVVTVNPRGKDVNHDDRVIWNNMAEKYKITEHRTTTKHKILDSAIKGISFIQLFKSAVLRKYNLTMVFVW